MKQAAAALLLSACAAAPQPDAGPRRCVRVDWEQRQTVHPANTQVTIPLSLLESVEPLCAHPKLLQDDGGVLEAAIDADAGVLRFRGSRGPAYLHGISNVHRFWFVDPPPKADLTWPRYCGEVRRLSEGLWACDGDVLRSDGTKVASAQRWLGWDAGAVSASGAVLRVHTSGDLDGGMAISDAGAPVFWSASDRLVVATATEILECDPSRCQSLGPWPKYEPPKFFAPESQVTSVVRAAGQTLTQLSNFTCWDGGCTPGGQFAAFDGERAWFGSPYSLPEYRWTSAGAFRWRDGGWSHENVRVDGPDDWNLGPGRGPAERVVFDGATRFLVLADATGEFEYFEATDAELFGAARDHFWASTGVANAAPVTRIYFRRR